MNLKKPFYIIWAILLLTIITLCACNFDGSKVSTSTSSQKTFTSEKYGFSFKYPSNLKLSHCFNKSYLNSAKWKTYTSADLAKGKSVVSIVLPKSNRVRACELRIGISKSEKAIKNCDILPKAAVKKSKKNITIDGINFITFTAQDAGMSHYQKVQSYRTVKNGICYAIDVLITGTNGKVYDPPQKPPFTISYCLAKLKPVVLSLRFFKPEADQPTALLNSLPATYKGELPCADCPGIKYQINLLKNHQYIEQLNYIARNTIYTQRGTWKLIDNSVVVQLSGGEKWRFKNDNKEIELLNKNGNKIKSKLNFSLKHRAIFLPIDSNKN